MKPVDATRHDEGCALMKRQCKICLGWFEERFFKSYRRKNRPGKLYRLAICRGCENKLQCSSRLTFKAINTARSHAKKYIQSGVIKSVGEFRENARWTTKNMVPVLRRALSNGSCAICGIKFSEMAGALAAITVDIKDPTIDLPRWGIDTQLVCRRCNCIKSNHDHDRWQRGVGFWKEWYANDAARQSDLWFGTLFQGMKEEGMKEQDDWIASLRPWLKEIAKDREFTRKMKLEIEIALAMSRQGWLFQ